MMNRFFILKTAFVRLLCAVVVLAAATFEVCAQDWYQVHVNYDGYEWAFPYSVDHVSYIDFDGQRRVQLHRVDDESLTIPFTTAATGTYAANADSLTFSNTLEEWGKDKYKVFALNITTDGGAAITSKEDYVRCYVSVDGRGEYPDLSAAGRIRGRGNSTWLWYEKKPYRVKFDTSTKVLGIDKNKDWVLLANYRDVTDMMNVYASITAKWMGIPFTTPVRFAEVFLNGQYIGVYQIAEQVEVGGNRVDIDETEGVLLTLDVDDGPGESPGAGDNFWTTVYRMPMAVKSPKDLSTADLNRIRDDFAELENAIKAHDYAVVDSLMDIPSYIAMLQLQEYLYNVELTAPRSIFLFRDKGGKYTFGPAWDWDAGYDFNWGDMTTGHTFFTDYRETLFGTNPYLQNGDYRNYSKFFTDMFADPTFVQQYKERWAELSADIYTVNWAETQKYVDGLNEVQHVNRGGGYSSPASREAVRWPLRGFDSTTETNKMKRWLQNRLSYLNEVIAAYPVPEEQPKVDGEVLVGTLSQSAYIDWYSEYSQSGSIDVSRTTLAQMMGVDASQLTAGRLSLVPLNADGSEGTNTAAKTYGAWFDANGNTANYSTDDVHVFIESDNLFSWNYGCRCYSNSWWGGGNYCQRGDVHVVMMQYRLNVDGTLKKVNVVVTFHVN